MTRLRQRIIEDMEIRTFSSNTIDSDVFCVAQLARHFKKSPDLLGSKEIRQYQIYLCTERKIARSTLRPGGLHCGSSTVRFRGGSRTWSICAAANGTRGFRLWQGKKEVFAVFSSTRNLNRPILFMTLYARGMAGARGKSLMAGWMYGIISIHE